MLAADRGSFTEVGTYDLANVSTTVTSQTNMRPEFHAVKVMPSGRLPSLRLRPEGSRVEGIPADVRARWMMSFKCE